MLGNNLLGVDGTNISLVESQVLANNLLGVTSLVARGKMQPSWGDFAGGKGKNAQCGKSAGMSMRTGGQGKGQGKGRGKRKGKEKGRNEPFANID